MIKKMLAAMLLLLTATQAFAGSTLSVSEYQRLASQTESGGSSGQIAVEPSADQSLVDFSGGVAASAAFAATTRFVRVSCSIRCAIKFGPAGSTTATTANKPLGVDLPEYFGVQVGQVVSVIASP